MWMALFATASVCAQTIGDVIERCDETGDEEAIDELIDAFSDAMETPIAINDTNAYVPEWLLTTFQRDLLRAYIVQHGYILTWEEMLQVNGMDEATVERLKQFCSLEKPDGKHYRLKEMLRKGKHNLVAGTTVALERARGYTEKTYEGRPYRLYGRYKFAYKEKLSLQLSAEKDAGEGFFYGSHKQGFDLYSGHLIIRDIGLLKSVAVGRYRLQFGQGLTLWSGSRAFQNWSATGYRYGRGICAASPFTEYDYLQGVAATLGLPHGLELSTFYSYARRDATIDTANHVATAISTSGYHRTATEIAKWSTLGEHLLGGNLQWNHERLHIGLTLYHTWLSLPLQPREYVYNAFAFRGRTNANGGLDASYRWRRVLLYGEVSLSQGGGVAGFAGIDCLISSDNTLSVVYRNYSAKYHNLHSSTWGRTSQAQNEEGFRLALKSRLPLRVDLLLQSDFYRHPYLRYRCYSPSAGVDLRTELSRQFIAARRSSSNRSIRLRVSHRYSNFMRNNSEADANEYYVETYNRHVLYGDVELQASHFGMRTRVGYSNLRDDSGQTSQGMLLLQDFSAAFGAFSFNGRVALFDAGNYDTRFYVAERGLEYDNGGTQLYGKGMRFYLTARYTVAEKLQIAVKYSVTAYADREQTGSGYEQVDGDHKQQLRLQLRYKW